MLDLLLGQGRQDGFGEGLGYRSAFDYDEQARAIKKFGGVAHRKTFKWCPAPNVRCSATSDYHGSGEEACKEAYAAALTMGYTAPRWWEYWRWSEERMPLQESAQRER